MSHTFVVIDAHIRLPRQKQDAALARLKEAIARSSFMQGVAEVFLFEYRKHKGNEPLSFSAMIELWGWYPTFEEKTGDLVGLTSFCPEIEDDELLVQHFLELLGLEEGDYVEVDIDHLRRRYLSFRGKISRLDANYVYPSLAGTIQKEQNTLLDLLNQMYMEILDPIVPITLEELSRRCDGFIPQVRPILVQEGYILESGEEETGETEQI